MSAQDYKRLTHEEHIRKISGMYIGSDKRVERNIRVFDGEKFIKTKTEFPEAAEVLFAEILSNAADNVLKSREQGVNPGSIKMWMDETTIIIENYGLPVPVEIHPEYEVYLPELLFGNLLTSSNYEGERKAGGTNGLGAKLVNLYSNYYAVELGDAVRGLSYKQEWSDLMKERSEPQVKPYKGKCYTRVTFQLNLSRFAYDVYPEEVLQLFAAHLVDVSLTTKVKVFFNDVALDFTKIEKYAALFCVPHIIHKDGNVEIALMDTSKAQVVSFANTKLTKNGGMHVEGVYEALKPFLKLISRGKPLTLRDLKPQISFVVNCYVSNPDWSDQYKTTLKFPKIKITFPETMFKKMFNWDLVRRLCSSSDTKSLAVSDGKKRKHIKVDNLQDANYAGTKVSLECCLYVVEGLSASGYAEHMRDHLGGRDYIGVYPIRGKLLNVMNANNLKIADNKVISKIKEVLGLREGLDYTMEANYATLRYGHVFILTDSDVDGLHICGLILNYFFCRFPSLLQIGFVKYLRTPIVRVTKGNFKCNFFTDGEYLRWKEETPDFERYNHKYCKGLGSSSPNEVKDDAVAPRVLICIYDDKTPEAMKLAFSGELTDLRKDWIEKFQNAWFGIFSVEGYEEKPISSFINEEMVRFSLDDMLRSIPRMMDGLKQSQRKIIWGAMDWWKNWHSAKKLDCIKVKVLAGKASLVTAYKHGEDILAKSIISMGQDYVGANNLPYLVPDGMFGTRVMLGKDAADTRYPHTYPQKWLRYVYKKEDEALFSSVIDEGKEIEPVFLLPIIPMILVNGAKGIGTGYSSFVPNHNPLEIIDWLQKRIRDEPREELLPWYLGFVGDIEVKPNGRGSYSMCTTGKFSYEGDKVTITEIPIGKSIHDYVEKVIKPMCDTKVKAIKDYRDNTKHDKVNIELLGFVGRPTISKLKLQKSFGLSNIVLLDLNDRPKKYDSADHVIEDFYKQRLEFYVLRKEKMLTAMQAKVDKINEKIRLVLLILEGTIVVNNRKKSEVAADVAKHNISIELLKEIKIWSLVYEQVEKLRKEGEEVIRQHKELQDKPPSQIWLEELEELKAFLINNKYGA